MLEVYRALARRLAAGEMVALATVVATRGSAPREAGATMAVAAGGEIVGTVGGGYPEAEVLKAALEAMRTGLPRLVRLDLTADIATRTGGICGGTMEVFVEPLTAR